MPDRFGFQHRRSIRLLAYDYRIAGAYFVTICTFGRRCILEQPRIKEIVERAWARATHQRYPLEPYDLVVMPNHVHGIVWITEHNAVLHPSSAARPPVGAQRDVPTEIDVPSFDMPIEPDPTHGSRAAPLRRRVPERGSLSAIVRSFKSDSAWRLSPSLGVPAKQVWQRSYYERIVRKEDELNRIRQYILDNPRNWATDKNNPAFLSRFDR